MRARRLTLHPMTAKKLLRLKREAEGDGAYRVAKRVHVVLLNHDGYTSGQITTLLKAPRSRVSEWLKNYERHGYAGLLEGYRSGRPREMTARNERTLADILDSGPVAYGFLSGVWTSPMIARVIQEEFGITYHPGHVRRLLHRLGFSVQRPRRTLARADAQQQDRWHRYTYPNLKKTPERKGPP
jgi:transposase